MLYTVFRISPSDRHLNPVSDPVVCYRQLLKTPSESHSSKPHFIGSLSIKTSFFKIPIIKTSSNLHKPPQRTHKRHTQASRTWHTAIAYNLLIHRHFQKMIWTQLTLSPRNSTSEAPTASILLVVCPALRGQTHSILRYDVRNGGRCCKNMLGRRKL